MHRNTYYSLAAHKQRRKKKKKNYEAREVLRRDCSGKRDHEECRPFKKEEKRREKGRKQIGHVRDRSKKMRAPRDALKALVEVVNHFLDCTTANSGASLLMIFLFRLSVPNNAKQMGLIRNGESWQSLRNDDPSSRLHDALEKNTRHLRMSEWASRVLKASTRVSWWRTRSAGYKSAIRVETTLRICSKKFTGLWMNSWALSGTYFRLGRDGQREDGAEWIIMFIDYEWKD